MEDRAMQSTFYRRQVRLVLRHGRIVEGNIHVTEGQSLYVAIETGSGLCRGQSVVDHLGILKKPANTEVVRSVSRDAFLRLLKQSVGADE